MASNSTHTKEHLEAEDTLFYYVHCDEITWNGTANYTLGRSATHALLGLGSRGYLGDGALLCHKDNSMATELEWRDLPWTGLKAPEGKLWKEDVVEAEDLRDLAKEMQRECKETYGSDWRKRWAEMKPATVNTQYGPMCVHFVQGLDDPSNESDPKFDRDVSTMLENCSVPTKRNMNLQEYKEDRVKSP